MHPTRLILAAAVSAAVPAIAPAQVSSPGKLKRYDVTIRRFDPAAGPHNGQTFVLPVDSPDEEHAIASTLANAASFSKKTGGGKALPVAFMAIRVAPR